MASQDIEFDLMTNEEIITLCSESDCDIVHEQPGSDRKIVKISSRVAIKVGTGVTESEANNQRAARRLIDQNIVRVPDVYRSFQDGIIGYIAMEFVEGEAHMQLGDKDRIRKIARALDCFTRIRNPTPGPIGGGAPRGMLWLESWDVQGGSVLEIETYFNSLIRGETKLNLESYGLCLCHLDLAPRNILWPADGSVCILDWECAGFYPRFFEVSMLRIFRGKDGDFNGILLDYLDPLTEAEETQAELIFRAYYNGQKYY